jgi:ribonuclease inhibitor
VKVGVVQRSSYNNRMGIFREYSKMLGPYADLILKIFQDAQNEIQPGKFYIVVK